MFGMKNTERALYERLLQEKERLIVALSDQVDWHRAHSGTYVPNHLTETGPVLGEQDQAFAQLLEDLQIGDPGDLGADEDLEELRWQAENGADPESIRQALVVLQGGRELPFDLE